MADDIDHIEGQGRGLQVQTSNQRTLLAELDTLMVGHSLFIVRSGLILAIANDSYSRR